jgi:O-antigen/teichoic acid export membrane protein
MNLRNLAVRGGLYLIVRQGLGILVSAVGLILLTRALGPAAYGLWAAAFSVYSYISGLSRWGVDVYLIRRKEEPQPQDYNQAFSLLLLAGLLSAGLAILALPFIESWVRLEGFSPIAITLFAGFPVTLLRLVPLARLERALAYRKIALVELMGQATIYVVAVPLAYQGLGPWAPVAGTWASQLVTLGLFYRMSGWWPRLHWDAVRVRAMLRYGFGFSASEGIWNLGNLVNPLIVGRYVGAEGVGQVALAIRLVEQLSNIVLLPVGRLSIPIFARLQDDRARLASALTQAISLQFMVLGPILAGFGLAAPWIVPLLLGARWLPALEVYPFIAVAYLSASSSGLLSTVLFVLGRLWEVAIFRLAHLILFAGSALLLVPHLGSVGYGWADVVALPSYALLLTWVTVYVGRPISAQAGVWLVSWTVPLFSWQLGPWTWVGAIVPLLWPATRRELLQTIAMVRRRIRNV